jgi:hypothetical protein
MNKEEFIRRVAALPNQGPDVICDEIIAPYLYPDSCQLCELDGKQVLVKIKVVENHIPKIVLEDFL